MPNVIEKITDQADGTSPSTAKVIGIIFNPVSGQTNADIRKREIEAAFAEHGYRCEYIVTTAETNAQDLVAQALKTYPDMVAVSGGDGTVIEAMAALIGSGVPLAILPSGTGNLLSINLGLPRDVRQAVETALTGQRRTIDMGTITLSAQADYSKETRHFAILAGVGYDADIIRDADRAAKKRMGLGAYLWAALKNLPRRPIKADIYIDGARKPIRRRAKSVMIANMGRLQGGIDLVPGAEPDDGLLNIAVLKAENLRDWIRICYNALRHRLNDDSSLEYHKAKSVLIRLSKPQPMQFDGEAFPAPQRSFRIEVVPNAVQVMVPRDDYNPTCDRSSP